MRSSASASASAPASVTDQVSEQDRVTEIELSVLARRNEVRRRNRQRVEDHEEVNTSGAWYFTILAFALSMAQAVKTALLQIPEAFFPENPAKNPVLFGMSAWTTLLSWLSPLALGVMWMNTIGSFKKLYNAEKRTYEHYAAAAINFLTSAAWTALYIVGLTATAYVAAHVVPYIAAAAFAVNAVFGLFNCAKYLYRAYKAWDNKEERNELLWNAAKQLVSIAVNTLGFVVGLFLGLKTSDAVDVMGSAFETARKVIYALAATSLVGAAMATVKFNQQTLAILRHPIYAFHEAIFEIKKNPLNIIPMLINFPVRALALITLPLQLMGFGIKKLFNRSESTSPTPPNSPTSTGSGPDSPSARVGNTPFIFLSPDGARTQPAVEAQQMVAAQPQASGSNSNVNAATIAPPVDAAPAPVSAPRR